MAPACAHTAAPPSGSQHSTGAAPMLPWLCVRHALQGRRSPWSGLPIQSAALRDWLTPTSTMGSILITACAELIMPSADFSRATCVPAGVLSLYGERFAGKVGGRGQCDSQGRKRCGTRPRHSHLAGPRQV